MKKRLLSLLLVLAVVFSFSLSAFATDTGIDIIDDPLSYYFENQMLGVQKGTGVTLVCPKCDYKVVYTGGTFVASLTFRFLSTIVFSASSTFFSCFVISNTSISPYSLLAQLLNSEFT